MPKVSVIIPCYNLGKYLDEAVDSVLSQTYIDYEIIIVNDGSTDEFTINLLKGYSKPKTVVLTTTNQGLPATRNYGIGQSSGEYICCLDADDRYHPEFLEKTVKVFEEDINFEYGIVTTNFELFEKSSDKIEVIDFNPYALAVENRFHVASLFRQKCWEEVGGYATNLSGYQDWNFWLSIISREYKWYTVKEFLFYYRDREGSMLKGSDLKRDDIFKKIIGNNKEFYQTNFEFILNEFVKSSTNQLVYIKDLIKAKEWLENQNNNKDEVIIKTQNQLSETQNQLSETQNQLSETQHQLSETQHQLSIVFNSKKWKIVNKLHKIFDIIFPHKTFRRRIPRFSYKVLRYFYRKTKSLIRSIVNKKKSIASLFEKYLRKTNTIKIQNKKWPNHKPLVSVVIPCFNYGKYVEQAIDSVLDQTFQNFEIIVIDGGSTDEVTHEILKKLNKPKTKIYFRDGRYLVGDNRNYGINLAKGKYVCCLDADDLLDSTYFEKALFFLETYYYDVVHPSVECFGAKSEIWYAQDTSFEKMMNIGNYVSTVAVFRREAWVGSGGYKDWPVGEGHIPEDWEFWTRLIGHGYRFKAIKEPLMLYRVHNQGLTSKCKTNLDEQRLAIYNENKGLLEKSFNKLRKKNKRTYYSVKSPFINLTKTKLRKRILLALPFVIIGGADAVLLKIFRSLSSDYDITIITTLDAPKEYGDNTIEYKKITNEIYHLSKFLDNRVQQKNFIHYLIESREIDLLFVVGCELIYSMLPDICTNNKCIKVVDQLFNEFGHLKNNRLYSSFINLNIAANEKIKEILINDYKEDNEKIRVIIHGVDVDNEFNPEKYSYDNELMCENKDEFIISFFGRFSKEKAPDIFVKIINLLKKSKVKAIMTGHGPEFNNTLDLIKSYNLCDDIYTPGFVEDIKPLILKSDVVIVPSRIEGLPIIILETLSMGIPVIASNTGGIPTVIKNDYNGYICDIEDVEGFVEKIKILYNDRDKLRQMKNNAREFALSNISEKKMNIEYNDAVKSLLNY